MGSRRSRAGDVSAWRQVWVLVALLGENEDGCHFRTNEQRLILIVREGLFRKLVGFIANTERHNSCWRHSETHFALEGLQYATHVAKHFANLTAEEFPGVCTVAIGHHLRCAT